MESESNRVYGIMRDREGLHHDIADGKLGAGAENSPVPVAVQGAVTSNCLGGESVAIDRHRKFPAKDLQTTDVIAMFVGEEDAVELVGSETALFQPQNNLARAQPAIHQQLAVIRRNQGAVSRAAAAKHGQTEHARSLMEPNSIHKWKGETFPMSVAVAL